MADVINLTKYRHDRDKAIDERIENAAVSYTHLTLPTKQMV